LERFTSMQHNVSGTGDRQTLAGITDSTEPSATTISMVDGPTRPLATTDRPTSTRDIPTTTTRLPTTGTPNHYSRLCIVAGEKWGVGQLPTLNFWLSKNFRKLFFIGKFASKNANVDRENILRKFRS